MRISKLLCLLIICFPYLICSCASTNKIQTTELTEYSISPTELNNQIKSNVSIAVEVLRASEYEKHPELYRFNRKTIDSYFSNSLLYYPANSKGESWLYTFGTNAPYVLTVFKVKVTNNTPHILRMKDSRIYLIADGENPVAAVTKIGNPRLVKIDENGTLLPKSAIEQDDSLVHWVTYFEQEYENNRKKSLIDFPYLPGLASQVIFQNIVNYKLINDLSLEILPDYTYEGILLFPKLVYANLKNPKLMFYDITTKTDAAGNVSEKTSFEFPLKYETVNMWYDTVEKTWKKGFPPGAQIANTN